MPLPDEHRSRFKSVYQGQESNRSGFQLKGSDVHRQDEILAAERVAESDVAKLAVNGV